MLVAGNIASQLSRLRRDVVERADCYTEEREMKNIYVLYDEFLVDNAYRSPQERAIHFAKWYSDLRIQEAIDRYRELKHQGIAHQLQFDEADIRGTGFIVIDKIDEKS